jgi:hypothetical protein
MLRPVSPCSATRTCRAPAPWQLTASNSQLPTRAQIAEENALDLGEALPSVAGMGAARVEEKPQVRSPHQIYVYLFWPSIADDSLSPRPPPAAPRPERGGRGGSCFQPAILPCGAG